MTAHNHFRVLQAGRGVAALMVIAAHVGAFVGNEGGLWHNQAAAFWLFSGTFGVDFFFIVSGMVILLAHWADVERPARAGTYAWKRFRRIYPMYWLVLVPTLIKQMHVDTGYAATQRNPFVILSSFLLVHVRSLDVNLLPSWTLFHEVLFYVAFSTLLVSRKLAAVVLGLWFSASLFFLQAGAFALAPASYARFVFSPLHLLFAFGMGAAWLVRQRRAPSQKWLLAGGLGMFVAMIVLQMRSPDLAPVVRILGDLGLTLAVVVAVERERTRPSRVPALLLFWGDASYSIYLTHFMVVSTLARQGYLLDRHLHLPIAVWCTGLFAVALAFGSAVHVLVERPLLRWLGGWKPGLAAWRPALLEPEPSA